MQIDVTPEYLASQHLSPTFPERFWAKVDKNGPIRPCPPYPADLGQCWIWTGSRSTKGYGRIGRGRRQTHHVILAHVASWILHCGLVPDGKQICHKCDVAFCVNPNHLFPGTNLENIYDMISKGRHSKKLSVSQIIEIRNLYQFGKVGYQTLANKFGVVWSTIRDVVRRKTWTHI